MVLSLLFLFSCDKNTGGSADPIIQIKSAEVSQRAGDMFVSVQAEGPWKLSLVFGDQEPWAELSTTEGAGCKNNIILSYKENTADEPRKFEIALVASGKQCFQQIIQAGKSAQKPIDPDRPPINPGKYVINASWMELPDMSDSNLDYVAHHFTNKGRRYRNYSIAYSEKDVVSIWVAYPLCASYLGSLKRTNKWAYDPVLKELSPAPFHGYGGSMDRGHLLPSGSRTCCVSANEQTFYGSNMAPQIGKGFNQNIWAQLEGQVRGYAKRIDTLYVVTGCILEGSREKSRDSDGKRITVPTGFYKALLAYHENSTYSKWMGAAFYLDHKRYDRETIVKSDAMSIDDLEKKTGIDFFPHLVEKIGKEEAEKIEKQNPQKVAFWW